MEPIFPDFNGVLSSIESYKKMYVTEQNEYIGSVQLNQSVMGNMPGIEDMPGVLFEQQDEEVNTPKSRINTGRPRKSRKSIYNQNSFAVYNQKSIELAGNI